jgi:hypothetical protein
MSYSNGKFVYPSMLGKWAMTTALAKVVAVIWLCMTLAVVHGDSLRTVGPAVQVVVEAEEAAWTAVQAWDKAEAAVKAYMVVVGEFRGPVVDKAMLTLRQGTKNKMMMEQNPRMRIHPMITKEDMEAALQDLIGIAKDRALTEVAAASKATIWLQSAAEVAVEVTAVQATTATKRTITAAEIWAKHAVEFALKAMAAEVVLNRVASVSVVVMKHVFEYTATLWRMPTDSQMVETMETKIQAVLQAVVTEMSAIVDVLKDVAVAREMAIAAAESLARATAVAAVDLRLTGGAGFEIAEIAVAQPTPADEHSVFSVPPVATEAVEASPPFPVSGDSRSESCCE